MSDVAAEDGIGETHLDARWPLDRDVEQLRSTRAAWLLASAGPIAGLALSLVVVVVFVVAFGLPHSADARAAYSLVGEALFGLGVFICTRPVAQRYGGWQTAFGLTAPANGEGRTILRWVGIQLGARILLAAAMFSAIPALHHRQLGNLTGVSQLHVAGAAFLLIAAVGV